MTVDPEIILGTSAILLPDMSNNDWVAECEAMYHRQVALQRFIRVIKGEVIEDFNVDDFLDVLEHEGMNPDVYCQGIDSIIESIE